jgi:hypothetical protein
MMPIVTMVIRIQHTDSLIRDLKPKSKSWFDALFSGHLHSWKTHKRLKHMLYWWIEIDPNTNRIIRQIGFDWSKRPLLKYADYELDINTDSFHNAKNVIGTDLFQDVWKLIHIRNFAELEKVHEKYLYQWKVSDQFSPPVFPIIMTNLEEPNDPQIILDVDNVFTYVDTFGYEWDHSEKVVDSVGNIYEVEYLNFGHPVGVVIPIGIIGVIDNLELASILGENVFEINK